MPQQECSYIKDGLFGDTLEFLHKNILVTDTNPESKLHKNTIRNLDFCKIANIGSVNVYDLIAGDGSSIVNGIMPVYFLPWAEDGGYFIVLDRSSGPDIMLTAQMNGCSVGYIRSADGTVRVSHHNMISAGPDMENYQRQTLSFAGEHTIHPSDYRFYELKEINQGELRMVSVKQGLSYAYGVRKDDGWHMYKQFVYQISNRNQWTGNRTQKWMVTQALEF